MLEVVRPAVSVVGVFGDPMALDALDGRPDVYRIAPDEAMVLDAPGAAPDVSVADPHAVVLDVSDGWTAFDLSGDLSRAAFARLSAVRLPDAGFVQGDVLRVPARVVVGPERVRVLVPAMWGDHVRSKILARCADMDVREAAS